jgi:adenosylcobinamide kinase/adenosylcobinamide-phosphate guanylyltransferase
MEHEHGRFYFVTGGARSGKSAYAEQLADALDRPVTYVATAEAGDPEMEERIARHRRRRPDSWTTVEEPRAVAVLVEKIGQRDQTILIDCLTLLITNLIYQDWPLQPAGDSTGERPVVLPPSVTEPIEERVMAEVRHLAEAACSSRAQVILVSNETGLGLVPASPEARLFRDLAGLANQEMATRADRALLLVSGLALDLKSLHCDPRQTVFG